MRVQIYLGNATSGTHSREYICNPNPSVHIFLHTFPGVGSGELLEDDGRSTAYIAGEEFIARTVANYTLDGVSSQAMCVDSGA